MSAVAPGCQSVCNRSEEEFGKPALCNQTAQLWTFCICSRTGCRSKARAAVGDGIVLDCLNPRKE